MLARIEIIKCRAVVSGEVKHWIMAADADHHNEAKARQIFEGETFHGFTELARAGAETSEPDAGLFTFVTAEMSLADCVAWAIEACGGDFQLLPPDCDDARWVPCAPLDRRACSAGTACAAGRRGPRHLVQMPPGDTMHQGYLNLPNFRNARDYQFHTHRERGAALASAHGLSPSGPGAWERRTEDWYGIHLVAYIPRDAEAGLFGISRRFDGVYASVACRTVDEASAALSAVTREEFEQSVQRGLQLRAQDLGSCALDIEGDAFGLEDDVQREPIQRAAQAVQLPLL